MLKILLVALTLTLLAAMTRADALYTAAELEQTRARSADLIVDVLRRDIIANLPAAQISAAATVRVQFPARGDYPLAFWSYPSQDLIVLPLESLRFFGDLSLVYAWFDNRQCTVEPVQAYALHVLAGNTDVPPLRAFGLVRDSVIAAHRQDPFTGQMLSADDLSQKLFSSALYFIMAHELGHILLNHTGGLKGQISQAQEREADRFALEHFARVGTAPIGMLYFYMVHWFVDPFGEAQSGHSHPLSADRVLSLADEILYRISDFTWREPSEAPIRQAALAMRQVSEIAQNDQLRHLAINHLSDAFPVAGLPQTCP